MPRPIIPDVAPCVACGVVMSTEQLAMSAFPDGEYRWLCRDPHPCARNIAAAEDIRVRQALHDDLDPRHGSNATVRHLRLRSARLRALITEQKT